MKVVLSESQFKRIVLNEEAEIAVCSLINESKNFESIKKAIKRAIIGGVAIATIISAINKSSVSFEEKEELKNLVNTEMVDTVPQIDSVFNKKVEAVTQCMKKYLGNQNRSIENCKILPEEIVRACDEENFSIPFLLAILQNESNFGMTPRAIKTNSPFSVGCFDNGSNKCKYSNQNESIRPFIRLIKEDYLINGKSYDDLLIPGNFVNLNGDRYAQNVKYERDVKKTMNSIIKNYPDLA